MRFEQAIKKFSGQPLSRQVLMDNLRDYKRPYDKINELVRQQVLVPVSRGLFVTGPALELESPDPFLVANHINGPSYVSLETALSHWRMIPERVFETASVTIGRTRTYQTRVGNFSYVHLPLPYYAFGQQRLEMAKNQRVLIASPEKALCDKIVTTAGLLFRSTGQVTTWLLEDMRMDRSTLLSLQPQVIRTWLADAPKKTALGLLVRTLENL